MLIIYLSLRLNEFNKALSGQDAQGAKKVFHEWLLKLETKLQKERAQVCWRFELKWHQGIF
jgi:hypothetical protein